jgi:hypothetical protein
MLREWIQKNQKTSFVLLGLKLVIILRALERISQNKKLFSFPEIEKFQNYAMQNQKEPCRMSFRKKFKKGKEKKAKLELRISDNKIILRKAGRVEETNGLFRWNSGCFAE